MNISRLCCSLTILLCCAGIGGATPFAYSISCQQLTVGPDIIQPYTQSGTVDLTSNIPSTANTIDFFNAVTQINRTGVSAIFNSALPCTFTLGGVQVAVNRQFQLVVSTAQPNGNVMSAEAPGGTFGTLETHTYTWQPFSFTVNIPGQGTVTVSQASRVISETLGNNFNTFTFNEPPLSSTIVILGNSKPDAIAAIDHIHANRNRRGGNL